MNNQSFIKALVAECIGTLLLALTVGVLRVGLSDSTLFAAYQGLYAPFMVGLTLVLLVYLFAPWSGGHFNPAVSFGMFIAGKLGLKEVIGYISVQVIGAFLGLGLLGILVQPSIDLPSVMSKGAFAAEAIGAFMLVLTVSQVALGKINSSMSGLVIGAALTVGLSIAQITTNAAVLNPAIALAYEGKSLAYLLAPFIGGAIAAGLGVWMAQELKK